MASSFGGTVKLTGESEYKKALKDITSNLKLVSSELKLATTEFSNGDKSVKQTKTSYDNMSKAIQEQKSKITELKDALSKAEKEYGSNNEKVRLFKTQLNNAENQLKQMESATDKSTKELKEMKQGFEDAGNGALKFGDILKANVLSDAIVGGIKSLGGAMKEVGSALVGVGKQALESYADYEQLIGGVETLFKDSAGIVSNYANNAYKTAGLSANEYMETVTSFSASLLQSLNNDTAKVAEVSDMAITDMADNANKMGTDMSMIQNAYQGFAKQNYTMLDNLKLGYGGTKTEMERLLKDATAISGVKYNISSLNDVYQAIHVIQGELGITGTTAKEASTTISGSLSSMKSAWQNLLTGIADEDSPLDGLFEDMVNSIINVSENIMPVVSSIIEGIGQVLTGVIFTITDYLPQILEKGIEIVKSLIDGIASNLPNLMPVVIELMNTLARFIVENLPTILQSGITILVELVKGIAESLPTLIPTMIDALLLMVETLIDNIDLIIDAGIQLIMGLADGLLIALPDLIEKIPVLIEKLVDAIVDNLPKLIEMGIELVVKLAVGLVQAIPKLIEKLPQIFKAIGDGLKNMDWGQIGKDVLNGIISGLTSVGTALWNGIKKLGNNLMNGIKSFFGIHSPSTLFRDEIGTNLALGIGEGFGDTMTEVSKDMANSIPTEFDVETSLSSVSSNRNNVDLQSLSFANAVKNALSGMHVVLDGDKVGELVINTVEEVVYS